MGISDGRIKDNQFTAPSAFDNDFTTFGAHRARLNTTGYRSAPENAGESWLKVDLGHTVVVTAIATQGYGNPEVKEWVTAYILLYSQGSDYVNFKDTNGETQVRGSSKLNRVLFAKGIRFKNSNFVERRLENFKDYPFLEAWIVWHKIRDEVNNFETLKGQNIRNRFLNEV